MLRERKQPLVRIDLSDKLILEQLSAKTGESTPRLLHRAVVQLKKQMFFERLNQGYANLKNCPEAWDAELKDRALFENASSDGL